VGAEQPPPGWYSDGQGLRWWSGTQWGPVAPSPAIVDTRSPAAGKTWAIVSHLGMFAGGFILPLAIYLAQKDQNDFVRHHARESLNFQLTILLVQLLTMPFFFVTFFASLPADSNTNAGPPAGFFAFFAIYAVIAIGAIVLSIFGAVRASQLVWWRYPVRIPFVRASR
jgi:uncharacterized Tic20 family protein